MLGYLSEDRIFFEKRAVFREHSSKKPLSFVEQMSKDKTLSIFLPKMEAIEFIILQISFTTRAVLKIGEYPSDRGVSLAPVWC